MGLFSKDYESAGAGISKNGPKKTGIRLYFDILWRKIWKLFGLNLLYMLFFVPLATGFLLLFKIDNSTAAFAALGICLLIFAVLIGPATAGLTRVMRHYVIEKPTFAVHDFFKGFKNDFGRASIIGIVDILMLLSVYAGYRIYPQMAEQFNSKVFYVLYALSLSVALVVIMMNFYIFLMLTATDLSFLNLIKNSFALMFVSIKTSLLTFLIVGTVLAAMIFLIPLSILLFILPFFPMAFLCFTVCFICYPVIQKYVINPFYTAQGLVNPELCDGDQDDDEEALCEDMGGKEKPIEKRPKGKGKRIS